MLSPQNVLYLLILIILANVIHLPAIIYSGAYGWDDGAITISFARTLAENGKIALTPLSPIVEGSSSLLHLGIISFFWPLFDPNFYEALFLTKAITFGFLILNALGLFLLINQQHRVPLLALATATGYLLVPMNMSEVINGMEMITFGTLLGLYVLAFQRNTRWAFLLIPAILLCRFEGAFYIGMTTFFVTLFAQNKATRRLAIQHLGAIVLTFAAITVWRIFYFDTFLPNTVWAKMNPPYSIEGLPSLIQKLKGGGEYLLVFAPIWLAGMKLISMTRTHRAELARPELWLILSFLVFGLITGTNWGYDGRMFLGVLPVAIYWLSRQAGLLRSQMEPRSNQTKISLLVSAPVFLVILLNLSLMRSNIDTVVYAQMISASKDSGPTGEKAHQQRWLGITPETYKLTGEAVVTLAQHAGIDQPIVAAPDVGGLGLCCANVRVVDTALLTNPVLARTGYAGLDEQLQTELPDVILTHGVWTRTSGIFDLAFFRETYGPVVFHSNLMYLRNDVLQDALRNSVVVTEVISAERLSGLRTQLSPFDTAKIGQQNVLMLNPVE